MSKYIVIGSAQIKEEDIRNLSMLQKIYLLQTMFDEGLTVDQFGEIVQHTDMMYSDSNKVNVAPFIPFVANDTATDGRVKEAAEHYVSSRSVPPISDGPSSKNPPREEEEEPISSGDFINIESFDEPMPPTVRLPSSSLAPLRYDVYDNIPNTNAIETLSPPPPSQKNDWDSFGVGF